MTATRDHAAEQAAVVWKERANCAGLNPELFFPARGEPCREALAICATCVVRAECLEYALANCEIFGIWGGKSERARRRIRSARRLARGRAPEGAA